MDGSWVCYRQFAVWCNFIIPWLDSSPRPSILQRWGNCSKLCKHFDDALVWRVVVTKQLNVWKTENGTIALHFGEKMYCKSPFTQFWGNMVDSLGVPADYATMMTMLPHITHTHPFNFPLSGSTQVSQYQNSKTNQQETVSGSGISWAVCKSAPRSRQVTKPAPHHSVFYRPDALPAAQPTGNLIPCMLTVN